MNPISFTFVLANLFLLVQSNACQKAAPIVTVDGSSKLNMTIYIESLCKFSKVFIQSSLKPIYEDIKDKVNLRFVTFALSESVLDENEEVSLKCFHGPKECEIDLFQTCSLHVYRQNKTKQAEIIFCTMRPRHDYKDCIEELQLDIQKIEKCTNGQLGTYLALKSQQEASNVVVTTNGVPSVIFNNLIDPLITIKALENLKEVVDERLIWFEKNGAELYSVILNSHH